MVNKQTLNKRKEKYPSLKYTQKQGDIQLFLFDIVLLTDNNSPSGLRNVPIGTNPYSFELVLLSFLLRNMV